MNLRRGFFCLWIAASLIWVAGVAWVLKAELTLDCRHFRNVEAIFYCVRNPAILEAKVGAWMLIPPLAVLALGFWVMRGFLARISN